MVGAEYASSVDEFSGPLAVSVRRRLSGDSFADGIRQRGLWGTGIGKGYQKLFYLPEPHTDLSFR